MYMTLKGKWQRITAAILVTGILGFTAYGLALKPDKVSILLSLFYYFVIVAFAVGIFLTNVYENSRKKRNERELFLISFFLLMLACLMPNDRIPGELSAWKRIAAFLLGLEGAFLIHSFMRFGEYSYSATTMTANINRLVTVIHKRIREKDRSQNYAILVYLMIFLSFLLGVACGYGYLHTIPMKESGWWHLYGYNLILLLPMACMLALWMMTRLHHNSRK